MRPLELSLTGFRSYPNPVTIDFTGKRLAAVLGDTGAGKSSLLDAITFALFRKPSWGTRELRQLITDGRDAMSVTLTFLHDDHRWRVERTMHATNSNAGRHHLVDLDTGQEEDGSVAVDARIKDVLGMSYETFLRVGLLPQGKFDQLLTASDKDRTVPLRELFGTDALDTVRRLAERHRDSLHPLIWQARTARATMPDDPARAAELAKAAADAADAVSERLRVAIDTISQQQKDLTDAAVAAKTTDQVARTLAENDVPDTATVLDALRSSAGELDARRAILNDRATAAETTVRDMAARITATEDRGEGRDALVRAAAVIQRLPSLADGFRQERVRITERATEHAVDAARLAADEQDLAARIEDAAPLAAAAAAAASMSRRLTDRGAAARTAVIAATTAAERVARAASAGAAAAASRDEAISALGPLEEDVSVARDRVRLAEEHRSALKLLDRAAAIAVELHDGDDCPVCRRQLPPGFEPATSAATELRAASARLREATTAQDAAAAALVSAHRTADVAQARVDDLAAERTAAELAARQSVEDAIRIVGDVAARAGEGDVDFDLATASASLTTGIKVVAARTDDERGSVEQHIQAALAAILSCEATADDIAARLAVQSASHTGAIDAERTALGNRRTAHGRAVDDARRASEQHDRAVARTVAETTELPDRIRLLLPDDPADVDAEAAAIAASAIDAALIEVRGLEESRDDARRELDAVVADRRSLDDDVHAVVGGPLAALRHRLAMWATAAERAADYGPAELRDRLPIMPVQMGIDDTAIFAETLSAVVAALHVDLAATSAHHTGRARDARICLSQIAETLTDIDGFGGTTDLADPALLHPLVAGRATSMGEAAAKRVAQRNAEQQIKPAADLNVAISAGQARWDALDLLRRELVEAKFLAHLTALNTRALLGIASELLDRLSDHRFGFAEDFRIVSRGSGVAHSATRLSGGEKFLASMALALALAELHSRGGPRLGSLFLDEGFAALDAAALESALDVLRAQVGGDRLVMVISHLHAVAEAVDDVLWIQKDAAASSAKWLTPAERDELVQVDMASGLQSLT